MTSVKKADPNKITIVTVMKNIVGPLSIERVLRATQKSTLRTMNSMNNDHPTQIIKIHSAVSPLPAFTSATLRASNVHPMMSLPTPADNTTIPTVVSSSLSSVRMRHSTGKAVIENATPVKSMKWVYDTSDASMKWRYKGIASAAPSPNGMATPAAATETESRTLRRMIAMSISSPTRKRKRQRPMSATSER